MKEIFTTPYKRKSAKKAIAGASEQAYLAKQKILAVNAALEPPEDFTGSSFKCCSQNVKPISEIMENISRNISKMDQNIYFAKAGIEKIMRQSSTQNNVVSLN
jgi:hypothetical protein